MRRRDETGRFIRQTMAERFHDLYEKQPEGCWLWTGEITKVGYGRITDFWEKRLAHRYSWEVHNDATIPDGMIVMHTCDERRCVNPEHLRLGTQAENMADMRAKGRANYMGPRNPLKGSTNPRAKLTEPQVLSIRQRYEAGGVTLQALADEHGVNKTVIHKVVKRETWRHVE